MSGLRSFGSALRLFVSGLRSFVPGLRSFESAFVRSEVGARGNAAVTQDYKLEIKRNLLQSLMSVFNIILQHFSPGFGKVRDKPGRRW